MDIGGTAVLRAASVRRGAERGAARAACHAALARRQPGTTRQRNAGPAQCEPALGPLHLSAARCRRPRRARRCRQPPRREGNIQARNPRCSRRDEADVRAARARRQRSGPRQLALCARRQVSVGSIAPRRDRAPCRSRVACAQRQHGRRRRAKRLEAARRLGHCRATCRPRRHARAAGRPVGEHAEHRLRGRCIGCGQQAEPRTGRPAQRHALALVVPALGGAPTDGTLVNSKLA